jgi:hypothetical protein
VLPVDGTFREVVPSAGYRSVRLILRSPAAAERQVTEYAESLQWPKIADLAEDPDAGTLREVVWRISSTTDLHYRVDDATGVAYVFIRADHPRQEDSFATHAEQHLDVLSRDELLHRYDAATGSEERGGALLILAVGSPDQADEAGLRRISAALQDPDPDVREAAVYAVGYSPSQEYIPFLRHIAKNDPVEELRADAWDMLDAYTEAGIAQ